MAFICAAILAVAAAVVAWLVRGREGIAFPALAFALAFIAVVVARYAFYLVV